MGDVLRAYHLVTNGAALSPVFERLAGWAGGLLEDPSLNTTTCACYQFLADGAPVAGNCQPGYLNLAYSSGLQHYLAPASVETRLNEVIFGDYLWDLGRWNIQNTFDVDLNENFGCFFIYDGVRGLKFLGSAIGLDQGIYIPPGGLIFQDGFESGDTSMWQ